MEYVFRYLGDGEVKLQGLPNLNGEGNANDRKRTPECCFSLG